ncbi:MAG: cobalamin-independent methionine synthase II family protein [Chloroflexi bacterium]|nr:cobalamin-independent methionine synthase II family protein [Chloroflexota bacterium]
MKQSDSGRISTTHTGSLPRPPELAQRMLEYSNGTEKDPPGLWADVASATKEVVARQATIGLDIISDGEYGKASYSGYVKERLTGFDGEPRNFFGHLRDQQQFPDWVRSTPPRVVYPSCNGPVALKDPGAVRRDIANLKGALQDMNVTDVFMSAASPGVVDTFMPNAYYPSDEEFLRAIAAAMRDEYQAIVQAGFILQVDCPDLAMSRQSRFVDLSREQFRDVARMHVRVLNETLRGLPRERIRVHVCWGNYEGPHTNDIPLTDILDVVLEAEVGAISIEAANPRHAHEWKLFRSVELPSGMKLIPGVIDTCTNYVEHPEVVAERIAHFVDVLGPERVIASTDCGFGTSVGPRHVAPSVAWAKLEALVQGAVLASGS